MCKQICYMMISVFCMATTKCQYIYAGGIVDELLILLRNI